MVYKSMFYKSNPRFTNSIHILQYICPDIYGSILSIAGWSYKISNELIIIQISQNDISQDLCQSEG